MLPSRLRRSRAIGNFMAIVINTALGGVAFSAAPALAAVAARQVAIPAGPLGDVLAQYAAAVGVQLVFEPKALAGMHSPGLQGNHSAEEGFERLLEGSGYELVAAGNGAYKLRRRVVPRDGAVLLPALKVSGDGREVATGPVTGYIARRTATGTKTDTPLIEVPQSVSVIGRQELDNFGSLGGTAEALRYTPGVVTENYGFDARGFDWLTLRGFDAYNTSDYRDGLNQVSVGLMNFRAEVYGLERIEILRGPSSALFGQSDVGGIVNKVSKLPRIDQRNELSFHFGNFERRQVSADVGGAIDGDGDYLYRLVGLGLDTDTQDQYPGDKTVSNQRLYLAPSFTWHVGEATSLTLLGEVLNNWTDGYSFRVTLDGRPTDALRGEPHYNEFDQKQSSIGYRLEHDFNERWTLQQNLSVGQIDVDYRHLTARGFLPDGHTLRRRAIIDDEDLRQTVVDTRLQGHLQAGAVAHTVLVGVDWSDVAATRLRLQSNDAPNLDIWAPVYNQPMAYPTAAGWNRKQTLRQFGVYAQEQARFSENWVLTAGGRQDRAVSKLDNRLDGSKDEQSDDAFSGRVGLNYVSPLGFAPYISYAESFLPQAGADQRGSAFEPTRGKQYELGVKYQPDEYDFLLTLAVFELRKKNVVTPDPTNVDYSVQTGEIRSRGFELELCSAITEQLNLHAAYAYNDVEVTRSNDVDLHQRPIAVPEQTASLWFDYAMAGALNGFGISGGARYVGGSYDDMENTSETPSYTIVDAALRYGFRSWLLSLSATNVFDKDYVVTCAWGDCYMGAERSVIAGVQYHW